ncbi:hypothetical protein ACFRCG_40025, partial [Embleya sp. NPDC056575]|uniref:hypothetical protein n=1 Tax=Embleya sp. NPDC056575 TaxID=3345869 RepID=UPI00368057A4
NIIDGLCWVPGCDRVHLPDLVVCSQDLDAEVGPPDAPKGRAARIAQWREYVELELNLAQQEVAALDEFDAR